MSVPARQIDGDVLIGRHVTTGGDATVRGSAKVCHDMTVEGWLYADNLKSKVIEDVSKEIASFYERLQEFQTIIETGCGLDEEALSVYLNLHGYATQSWVNNIVENFLTKDIADELYQPKGEYPVVDLSPFLTKIEAESTYLSKTEAAATYLAKAVFDDLFEKVTVNGKAMIKARYDFFSVGDVSAYGADSSAGSGGSTGGAGLDITRLEAWLTDNGYVTDSMLAGFLTKTIADGLYAAASHSHSFASITGKPTTLAGYGITDAYTKTEADSRYATASSLAAFVKKAGDNMTGPLTVPTLKIVGPAVSSALLTADTSYNAFMSVGGRAMMVWDGNEASVRPGNSFNNTFSLGKSTARWANVYATTINVSSTALVSNLNADLLDGFHAGITNGTLARYVSFPDFNVLISAGYLGSDYSTLGHPDERYFQALVKWAIVNFPDGGILQGMAWPSSQGFCVIHLYNTDKDASTGYPRYCTGLFNALGGNLTVFRTNNYVWSWGGTFQGNATSATKLRTARTLWGQSFDGTGNVSGNLTDVGSITSGYYYLNNSSTNPYLRLTLNSRNWYVQAFTDKLFVGAGIANSLQIAPDGSVGIGLASSATPAYKLDVNGPARVGSIRIGECTLSWDPDKGMLKSDKGFYSTANVSAYGADGSAGSSGGTSGTGIDEAQLAAYLDANGYVQQTLLSSTLRNYYTKTEVDSKDYIKVISCYRTTEWNDFRVSGATALTLRAFDVYEVGGAPSTYGNILEIAGRSNHWQPQLWFDSGATGSIRHRNKAYNSNAWGQWHTLLDSNNYPSVLDGRYVTRGTAQEITAAKTFKAAVTLDNSSLLIKHPSTTGGTAKTIYFKDYDDTTAFGFGSLLSNHVAQHAYIGWGDSPWDESTNFAVSADKLRYKGNDILHAGNYAAKLDGRYVTKDSDQTIGGSKTFTYGYIKAETLLMFKDKSVSDGIYIAPKPDGGVAFSAHTNYGWTANIGSISHAGDLTMKSFIKTGGTSSQFLKANGSVDDTPYATVASVTALTNSLAAFVKKAGDTMTGNLSVTTSGQTQIYLSTSGTIESGMGFRFASTNKGWVGYNATHGTILYSYGGNHYLGIHPDGTPHFDGNTLWHAGNDGSGSGLDADLLDGWHRDDIRKGVLCFQRFSGTQTAGGCDLNTLAPDGGAISNYGGTTYWANAPQGATYGVALKFSWADTNLGGMLFADINHNSATDVTRSLWWRASGTANGAKAWGQWHQIAFTDGNIASATKLADNTAFKAWGQPFFQNGKPQPVSGNLTDVGSISASGNVELSDSSTGGATKIWSTGRIDLKLDSASGTHSLRQLSSGEIALTFAPARAVSLDNYEYVLNLGGVCLNGKRLYLDAARTAYIYYDAVRGVIRSNVTLMSEKNVTAYQ